MIIKTTKVYPDAVEFTIDNEGYTLWESWSGDKLSFDLFKTAKIEQGITKKIVSIPSESIMRGGEFQWKEIADIIESIELDEQLEAMEANESWLDENHIHEWFENNL